MMTTMTAPFYKCKRILCIRNNIVLTFLVNTTFYLLQFYTKVEKYIFQCHVSKLIVN
jgi:hypothetical protein